MPLLNVVTDLYYKDSVDPSNGFHNIVAAGILGVIHKATQDTDFVDPEYDGRRARALSVNLFSALYG